MCALLSDGRRYPIAFELTTRHLSVGPYRVIFTTAVEKRKRRILRCLFAERRSVVYSVFSRMLKERILKSH